ncbi:glycoside hydrolase family protein [Alcaligenes faecalis]|uniref:glycoside hydrolase family protein n=1 Tax=Alcaligenes faecalis TaxID=511 RepID=UPI0038F74F25
MVLASFVYNPGGGAYGSFTLLHNLRAGDKVGAHNQLPRLAYAGSKRLRGREPWCTAERQISLSGPQ